MGGLLAMPWHEDMLYRNSQGLSYGDTNFILEASSL